MHYLAQAPLLARSPALTLFLRRQVALLGQGRAHLGLPEYSNKYMYDMNTRCLLADGGRELPVRRRVDRDHGVDDGHGRDDSQHHSTEEGQAEAFLTRLRRVLQLGHDGVGAAVLKLKKSLSERRASSESPGKNGNLLSRKLQSECVHERGRALSVAPGREREKGNNET